MADNTCPPGSTLDFSVREMNQILAGSVINCSTRYNCECECDWDGPTRLLTLEEAIPLVQEKERCNGKIITFLNKDINPETGESDPHIEVWVFGGKTISSWFDVDQWRQIPVSIFGKAGYILSSSVRKIEVVDLAPAAHDNILYFEYEPLPDQSTYRFKLMLQDEIVSGVTTDAMVNLYTYLIGKAGIDRVRILFGVSKKPSVTAQVNIHATDILGNEYEFVDQGYWGPPYGFNLPVDYEAVTEASLLFNEPGKYTVFCKLVQVDKGTVLSVLEEEIEVL